MAYTNAIFWGDLVAGSDAARADLVPTAYANNGSGLVRVTCNSTAAYSTDAVFDIAGTTGSVYVGAWKVTIIDGTHVDLQGSTFTVNPAAKGTMTPRGGSNLATDAWLTGTNGPTSARTASGDTINWKKTADPTSLGVNGTWTDGPLKAAISIASSTNATPIVVTLSGPNYTLLAPAVGMTVQIASHATNTNANGTWKISAVNGSTTVTLVNADGTNSVGNGIGGATGTVRNINNRCVILASAVTKNIAVCGNQGAKANWTTDGGANVVCSVSTADFKEGGECQSIAVQAGFVTGLAAHFATGTLDLSGYQQVSFWIKQTAGTIAIAADCRLELSTDTTGTTVVHNLPIPALAALNQWVRVTVDLGTNMNTGIKSIGWNQLVDRGAVTFLIDNIIACKASSSADSLTGNSLIGKNTATESFWCIQSINDVRVALDMITNTLPNSTTLRGYTGTTETVTAYKRESFQPAILAAATTAYITPSRSGLTFVGGYNASQVRDGETWIDGRNGFGRGFRISAATLVTVDRMSFVRMQAGYSPANATTSALQLSNSSVNGCTDPLDSATGVQFNNSSVGENYMGVTGPVWMCAPSVGTTYGSMGGNPVCKVGDWAYLSSGTAGVRLAALGISGTLNFSNNAQGGTGSTPSATFVGVFNNVIASNNGGAGIGGTATNVTFLGPFTINGTLIANNNALAGFLLSGAGTFGYVPFYIREMQASGNVNALQLQGPTGPLRIGKMTSSNNGTCLSVNNANNDVSIGRWVSSGETLQTTGTPGVDSFITRCQWFGNSSTDNRQYIFGVQVVGTSTAIRHTASGMSWYITPPNSDQCGQYNPVTLPLAQIAVQANKLVTVKCWMYRDNVAALVAKLVCFGGQLTGVASDVSVTASGAINTWAEETITFTPTEAGVIQIVGQAYGGGGTANVYFDDMTFTQGGRVQRATLDFAWLAQPFAPIGPAIPGSMFLVFP